ncbi:uncharacterized protein LOC110673144 isoform X2 [Hevea brasiliensis]|uniref:uncharacterized protein LOC110673144 isoform X2 n=1 Tax=Hevea brasiliensis TaxID=3981 RepID=UPI0025E71B23|nr:uncharacterized protein LOC110673144 isoform X2 [Hevea brasiliensis]
MVQHERYWQTNTSVSPPPSRWDFTFPFEELPNDSRKGLLLTSPDLSSGPQWTPPVIQEINADDYETGTRRGNFWKPREWGDPLHPFQIAVSLSTHSSYAHPLIVTFQVVAPLSKAIHSLFFPTQAAREASENPVTGLLEFDAAALHRDAHCQSSASSSVDFSDISKPFESEILGRLCISYDTFKCGLCERFLSQRSLWSSQQIVRSGDMPVTGVHSCCHVFHAECLGSDT